MCLSRADLQLPYRPFIVNILGFNTGLISHPLHRNGSIWTPMLCCSYRGRMVRLGMVGYRASAATPVAGLTVLQTQILSRQLLSVVHIGMSLSTVPSKSLIRRSAQRHRFDAQAPNVSARGQVAGQQLQHAVPRAVQYLLQGNYLYSTTVLLYCMCCTVFLYV